MDGTRIDLRQNIHGEERYVRQKFCNIVIVTITVVIVAEDRSPQKRLMFECKRVDHHEEVDVSR